MVADRPPSRREVDVNEPAYHAKVECANGDSDVNQRKNGFDAEVVSSGEMSNGDRTYIFKASSIHDRVEPLPSPEVLVKSESDMEIDADDLKDAPGPMDIESGYFEQIEESEPDTDMEEPLLKPRMVREEIMESPDAAAARENADDIKKEAPDDPAVAPPLKLESSDSKPNVKFEDSVVDDTKPSTSAYPLSSISGGSMQKWTSSDDLALPTLFQSPVLERRGTRHYGMTGLNNLGNSCYLNSVVQCLSNTRELRDYFLSGVYKREINTHNRMGTKGRFARIFDATLQGLWRGDRQSYSPTALRDMMAERNDQFSTLGQQDAQEAITFIVDSLHEDLNRITDKPYLSDIESDNRPVQEVADQTWDYHRSRENSAINDLFTGMFKSTVKCLTCNKENIKFDPYHMVSVPVPKYGLVIDCFFWPRDPRLVPRSFRVELAKEHTVAHHSQQFEELMGVPLNSVRILVTRNNNTSTLGVLPANYECMRLEENMTFLIYEILTEEAAGEPVHTFTVLQYLRLSPQPPSPSLSRICSKCRRTPDTELKRCTRCYSVRYCNAACQKSDWEFHKPHCEQYHGPAIGLPFVVSIREKQLTPEFFYMTVAKAALHSVTYWKQAPSKRVTPEKQTAQVNGEGDHLSRKHSRDSEEPESPSPDGDSTLTTSVAGDAEDLDDSGGSETAKKKLVEWDVADSFKEMMKSKRNTYPFKLLPLEDGLRHPWSINPRLDSVMKDAAMIQATVGKVSDFLLLWSNIPPQEKSRVEAYEIEYDADPSCRALLNERERLRRAAVDSVNLEACISLLTKPEVLDQSNAWKCPACKVLREASRKFELWSLPEVLVFQLKRFSKPSGEVFRRDKIETHVDYPLECLNMKEFLVGPGDGQPYLYDLYGAVIHRGSTWYGHYVTYARCYNVPDTTTDDMPWRYYDDETVDHQRDASQVVNRGAYLLFYRRRKTANPIALPPAAAASDSSEDSDDADTRDKGLAAALLESLSSPARLVKFFTDYCNIL